MGSFTKVYQQKYNPERTLTLTWDVGYTNVVLLDNGRVVAEWVKPGRFQRGVTFEDEQLGTVQLKFTDTRPLQLELRVKRKKYVPLKKGKQEFSVFGSKFIFWLMFIMTVFYALYTFYMFQDLYSAVPEMLTILTSIFVGVSLIYLFTALMLVFKKYWAFFIGLGYFALSTILYTYISFIESDYVFLVICFIRLGMLVYLIFQIKTILFAIRSKRNNPHEESSVLDSEL
ncbi:MAG: hypothetical protein NXI10_10605 [bacterium]|nr:hypothetical protein [bacterium]